MAYAMYLRKSRKDDDTGLEDTLSRHEKMLRDLADRMGIVVSEHDIYREIVSGESIEARPQMQRLLKAVEMRTYTGVLCVELERLSRGNGEDQARILKAFQFSDTKIVTLTKTYDLAGEDEFDEEFFEFGLFMSRREYKTIKRRLLRGRMQSQQEGYYIGSTLPFGYGKMKNPTGKGYILIPNEQTPILQMIFERYANGDTLAEIMHDLNTSGIQPSGSVKAAWTGGRLREILKNRVYIGEINVKTKSIEQRIVDGRIVKTERRNLDHGTVKGKHEPIISMDTWDKCQARLKSKTTKQNIDRTLQNPLSTLIYCTECGKAMRRTQYKHKGNVTWLMACPTCSCPTTSTKLEIVERMVIDTLKTELEKQQTMLAGYAETKQENTDAKTIETLKSEIAKKDKMLERVDELYEMGDYTRSKYIERSQKLNAQKAELMRQLHEVDTRIAERENNHERAVPILTKVLDEYHDLQPIDQNRLLKMIIDRIEYTKHKSGTDIEPELRFRLLI